jgi:hypothetical protein
MVVRRAVLVIADINGCTDYMQWNRTHLAHAQSLCALCTPLLHDFEGIGEISTHYIDLTRSPVPVVPPKSSFLGRMGLMMKLEMSTLPVMVSKKEPAEGFRNMGRGTEHAPA